MSGEQDLESHQCVSVPAPAFPASCSSSSPSQLLLSLFRIIEPASGTICIDGLDITKVGLHVCECHLPLVVRGAV